MSVTDVVPQYATTSFLPTMKYKIIHYLRLFMMFLAAADTTLTLSNVQLRQSGAYQCFAKNSIGMAYASARLLVIDPQRVNNKHGTPSNGGKGKF